MMALQASRHRRFARAIYLSCVTLSFIAIITLASPFRRLGSPTYKSLQPPIARRDETRVVLAGNVPNSATSRQSSTSLNNLLDPPVSVPDPYGWIRDESRSPASESYKYIEKENRYTKAYMEPMKPLEQELYRELLGHLKETDYSFPAKKKNYQYYERTIEGRSYVLHCRAGRDEVSKWDGSAEMPVFAGEEVYLDENELAEGNKYSRAKSVRISKSEQLLGFTIDNTGNEIYDFVVKDLSSGKTIHRSSGLELDSSLEWADNDNELFIVEVDAAQRPFRVYKRTFNPDGSFEDKVLFEDLDELFWVGIYKSSDEEFLFIQSESSETTEILYLPLKEQGELNYVAKRKKKVLYNVEHHHGQFLLVTNVGESKEMRLMVVSVSSSNDVWSDVVDKNGEVLFGDSTDRVLNSVQSFDSHIVIMGREDGLPKIWIMTLDGNTASSFTPLKFNEMTYDVDFGPNYEYDSPYVVIEYSSPITPPQHIQVPFNDIDNGKVLKQKEVPNYDPNLYASERVDVLSSDGKTKIPVTIVYRKSTLENKATPVPTHLYAYGAYGEVMDDYFSTSILPLLDRGIVYVTAHVRGGGERGRKWYEEPDGAKYLCKKHTFQDFVDVAKWLIRERQLTDETKLSCEGGSAGGLTVGASLNMDPELFKVAVLEVPFVDVFATMTDSSIPLTAGEWEEWGNPNEEKYSSYMLSYSPMNNVQRARYPSILITGGLHDPRVQYWEPTKFAATLRHTQDKSSGPVLLKIDLDSGHLSSNDRYKYFTDLSFNYAFLLAQLGLVVEMEVHQEDKDN